MASSPSFRPDPELEAAPPHARFSIAAQHDAAAQLHAASIVLKGAWPVRMHVDVMTAVLEGHAFAVSRLQHMAEFYAYEARRFYEVLRDAHDVERVYAQSDVHRLHLTWLTDMAIAAQQHAWAFSLAARELHHHA